MALIVGAPFTAETNRVIPADYCRGTARSYRPAARTQFVVGWLMGWLGGLRVVAAVVLGVARTAGDGVVDGVRGAAERDYFDRLAGDRDDHAVLAALREIDPCALLTTGPGDGRARLPAAIGQGVCGHLAVEHLLHSTTKSLSDRA
jgi:hypothetical protein